MAPTVPTSPPDPAPDDNTPDKKTKPHKVVKSITKAKKPTTSTTTTRRSNIFAGSRTSVPKIREVAKELQIEHYTSLSKSQLLHAILSHCLSSSTHKSQFRITQSLTEVRDMASKFGIKEEKLQEKNKYEVMKLILEKQVKEEKKRGGKEWKEGITRLRLKASELRVKNYTKYSKEELREVLADYDEAKKQKKNKKGEKEEQAEDERMKEG